MSTAAKAARVKIPSGVRDAVLDEYNHRCAVCGAIRPQLHHINEDRTDNDPLNLLPLCPNCHLTDQHNPTRMIAVEKLQLFRRHRDPCILSPEFNPLFKRQAFLASVHPGEMSNDYLTEQVHELTEFVRHLKMGEFYSAKLNELLKDDGIYFSTMTSDDKRMSAENAKQHRAKLIKNRDAAQSLLVEMLVYQGWDKRQQRSAS